MKRATDLQLRIARNNAMAEVAWGAVGGLVVAFMVMLILFGTGV